MACEPVELRLRGGAQKELDARLLAIGAKVTLTIGALFLGVREWHGISYGYHVTGYGVTKEPAAVNKKGGHEAPQWAAHYWRRTAIKLGFFGIYWKAACQMGRRRLVAVLWPLCRSLMKVLYPFFHHQNSGGFSGGLCIASPKNPPFVLTISPKRKIATIRKVFELLMILWSERRDLNS